MVLSLKIVLGVWISSQPNSPETRRGSKDPWANFMSMVSEVWIESQSTLAADVRFLEELSRLLHS